MNLPLQSARLDSIEAIGRQLDQLVLADPRLIPVRAAAGEVVPRIYPTGFAGMARVICGQQLSVASARAIWSRFELLPGALEPAGYLELSEEAVRGVGFSRGKFLTVRVIAEAIVGQTLDFDHLTTLPIEQAVTYLVAHKGIGPWTAEVYLLFGAGHPDVFPAGDLALRKAVGDGLALGAMPGIAELTTLASAWSPHRSVAALLFWRYFAASRQKEGISS
jgi:DNA-3-methyladenine glycosylase II